MKFQACPEVSSAGWIVDADVPWHQLVQFGPAMFPAYARLRFIPDPKWPGQEESDADLTEDHPSDLTQALRTLGILRRFTASPDDAFCCIWEGYSDVELPALGAGSLVAIPRRVGHRRYVLFRGALPDLGQAGQPHPPAFIWPADHTWCFASDVDPHWAGIGGSAAAIDALVADPRLDVVIADPARSQPRYF